MRVISSTIIALMLASSAAVFCAPAHAESVEVGYGDLDLASPAGVATLEGRINRAIRKICGFASTSLQARSQWKACVAEARHSAEPQFAMAVNKASREAYAEASLHFRTR